jgi:hypothetical protein
MRVHQALTAAALATLLASAAAGEGDFKDVHRTIPLDAKGRAFLETYKGSIDVTAWDRNEIEVSARVEPDPEGEDQAEKVRETEIRIEGSGSSVRIESDYGRVRRHGFLGVFGDDGTLPFVHYAIRMPRTARLEIKDYKSKSRITGLADRLDFNSYKGDIRLTGLEGPVRLETYKGTVHADLARFAESRFETYKGEIEIALPADASFDLDADLGRHGDLDSDFPMAVRSSEGGGHHRSSVGAGGPHLELETYKGTFRLRRK